MNDNHERMTEFYTSGEAMPWDDVLPPPEVVAWVDGATEAGRALDLGCGPGRAARYLAGRGWQVDAVDFVAEAIEMARARSAEFPTIRYHHASVTDLAVLQPPYQFAVDVGCGHALDAEQLAAYVGELARLLAPGATFLLFGKLYDAGQSENGQSGFDEAALHAMLTPHFTQENAVYGTTTIPDATWRSGWFWLRRR